MMIDCRKVARVIVPAFVLLSPAPARAQDTDSVCIAASESAIALHKAGRLIDARKALADCSASVCPDPVRASCQQRLPEADHAIPSVVFQVRDAAGNDLAAVQLTMDGRPLEERVGAALTLDPGPHTFTFEAQGLTAVTKTLVLVEGVKDRSEVVVLGAPPPPSAPPTPPAAETAPPGGRGGSQRTIGLLVGGVGLAGLAVGSVFGLMASSKWNTAQGEAYPQSSSDEQSASGLATASTIAFVAGGVAVAAGAVLWLTAPSDHPTAASQASAWTIVPSPAPGGGGMVLRGGF
jgi:hypothetical protein